MRNYKFSFIISVAFSVFVLSLSCSFSVKASSLTASVETIEAISNGFQSLEYCGMSAAGFNPVVYASTPSYKDVLYQVSGKRTSTSLSSSDFVISDGIPIDILDSLIESDFEFVDSNGNYLYLSDLSYATFDNGSYSGSCLLNSSGDMVYILDDNLESKPFCDVKFGGSEVSSSDWEDILSDSSSAISSSNYNYNLSSTPLSSTPSYYVCYGIPSGGRPGSAESLFISNQYIPGLIVPYPRGNYINRWYANDLSFFNHNSILGGLNTFSYSTGSYSYGGYDYSYLVSFAPNNYFTSANNNTLGNWLDGNNVYDGYFANTGVYYDSSLDSSSVVPFNRTLGASISLSVSHALSDILSGARDWSETAGTSNPAFDPDEAISANNYPYSFPIDDTIAADPSVPVVADPSVDIDPDLTVELDLATSGDFNLEVPFLSNILNRYPFCIPRDLARFVGNMRRTPTAPAWDFDYTISCFSHNYTVHFHGDLSDYDDLARIFRSLLLISFIIALALFSYNHHF